MTRRNKYNVLGVGTPIIDHILRVSNEFLETIEGAKGGMQPVDQQTFDRIIAMSEAPDICIAGGSCCNMIKGLAYLGHPCALVGKIGVDAAAEKFYRAIEHLPIFPRFIETTTPTAQVIALVTPDGQRTMRTILNASSEMRGQDLHRGLFEGVDLVHIEGYSLLCPGLTARAMELACSIGAQVSFDLASFEVVKQYKDLILDLLKNYVDIVFANEEETQALVGDSYIEGCNALKEICPLAIVLRGKNGCVVGHESETFISPATPVNSVVDTTGAGDLFAAGFLHRYLHGASLKECAKFGGLLGATVVQVLGAEIPVQQWRILAGK